MTPQHRYAKPAKSRLLILTGVALVLGSAGCNSKSKTATDKAALTESSTATAATPPEPIDAAPKPAATVVDGYSIVEQSQEQTSPPFADATASAKSIHGDLEVTLDGFIYYCNPAPAFAMRRDGETFRLTLKDPGDTVSRCMAAHDMTMMFPDVDERAPLVTRLEIVDENGKVLLVSKDVTRAR